MDWQAILIAGVSAIGGGGLAGIGVALIRRPVDSVSAATVFQQALNSQAQAFIATLTEINRGLEQQVGRLEERVRELEDENLQCRGENRDLRQRIDSLERKMRRKAAEAGAKLEGAVAEVVGGEAVITIEGGHVLGAETI